MSVKIERLNDIFVKEISYILQYEVKDETIGFVTVTDCEITSDLSFAKVFNKEKEKESLAALNRASKFIRGELSRRVDIRHTPELKFLLDESIEYGRKIESLIEKINKE